MKIAATGRQGHRQEIASKSLPADLEWTWVDSPAALSTQEHVDLYLDLAFEMEKERIAILSRLPGPVMINSVIHTLAEISALADTPDAPQPVAAEPDAPFARINGWPGFLTRGLWELAVPDEDTGTRMKGLLSGFGQSSRIVPDLPGMIGARILCSIINEAYYTLQEQVSTREEIDTAMKLGTNYPMGPFEWGTKIGLPQILALLMALNRTGKRYAPAAALQAECEEVKI